MRAAATTVDLTPTRQVALGAGTSGQAFSVADKVEANLLAFFPEEDPPMVLVSLDLLYAGPDLETAITAALPGVPRERIMIAASHTHAAPMTDRTKPLLGLVDEAYLTETSEKLAAAAKQLMSRSNRFEVSLRSATGFADHSINRRRFKRFFLARRPRFNQVMRAPNPAGPRDETVVLVRVERLDGTPAAFLWNYACHPVDFPMKNAVSAHFPGAIRERLRGRSNSGLPVLFFQGFSADVRPRGTARARTFLEYVRRITSGPIFGTFSQRTYNIWSASLADYVVELLPQLQPVATGRIQMERLLRDADDFVEGWERPVSFQLAKVGPEMTLVGVSAEVAAGYAPWVRELMCSKYCINVGCLDTPFGYAATASMLSEGGYESGGFATAFGVGAVNPKIEDNMLSSFKQLAEAP